MRFLREIAGHQQIVQTLMNAVSSGHVVHAYLFAGPAGVGKKTTARAFARALLCSQPAAGDACGVCRTCRQAANHNHPDLYTLQPSGASIKIEQVRGMLRRIPYRSYQGGRKVFLINQAELMTADASNCLLKTLEEPPGGTVMILVSDQPQSLLPTILSRCQMCSFKSIPLPELTGGLVALHGLDPVKAGLTAAMAGGSMGKALAYAAGTFQAEQSLAIRLAHDLDGAAPHEALVMAGQIAEQKEKVSAILEILKCWYRDLLVFKLTGETGLLYHLDHIDIMEKEAGSFETGRLLEILEEIETTRKKIEANANTRLALDILFLHLAGRAPGLTTGVEEGIV
ncbi:DNA polymerase III subunit tau [Pelotomaculum schinkii]|uniref:DNA polymerase III subunit delta' n=1 Tax=Pelotomaculum schinkii TaxID=78350 RepID=A0A4Y7RHK9_9FIRM|nr:DNA polymerase III subunit delta' [Pelotomaculum schinkii]TEB08485.1 DNA polymerase III subunit tau [Pelotomaculum schinkii]